MTHPIYPCLWFDGQAKEAAEFYCSVFQQSKIISENPMVVNFEINSQKIMCLNGGPLYKINPSISFFVICEEDTEIETLWSKLSENGKIMMPLDTYDWSEKYGFVQDKYGVCWQIMKGDYARYHQKIIPSFLFVGNQYNKAESAVNFFTTIFPTSEIKELTRYEEGGTLKFSLFTLNNSVFSAMDGFGNHEFTFNEGFSFVVECDTQQEIDTYWEQLIANGGQESQCGWLKDAYGVSWQIIPSILKDLMSDSEKSSKVIQAFLQMKKFDIATLLTV